MIQVLYFLQGNSSPNNGGGGNQALTCPQELIDGILATLVLYDRSVLFIYPTIWAIIITKKILL